MQAELLQAALDEALKFGPAARMLLTFPGSEDSMAIRPLAYNRLGGGGFRIEIRVPDYDDQEMVDDVVFVDAASIETVELQVKPSGDIWKDEPFAESDEEEGR